jgi:hypothetical protein
MTYHLIQGPEIIRLKENMKRNMKSYIGPGDLQWNMMQTKNAKL